MLVDVGEVVLGLLGILVGHVKIDVVLASLLHLVVNGTGDHVARRQRQARVILLHELLTSQVAQYAAVAAHGFGDQEGGTIAGMIQGRGMELDKLHVLDSTLGTIDHGDTITSSYQRIGRGAVNRTNATRCHQGHARQEGIHLASLLIEDIGTIALDARSAACHDFTQVVLGENLHGKVVFIHVDARIGLDRLDER